MINAKCKKKNTQIKCQVCITSFMTAKRVKNCSFVNEPKTVI